jgi:hypothetical protein
MPPRKPKPPRPPTLRKPWELPARLEKGDDKPEPLYMAVGKALTNWERVENQAANLFTTFVGARVTRDAPTPALRAYGAIISFSSRADMLEAAAKAYFLSRPGPLAETWSDLLEELRNFAARRNDIAHAIVEPIFDFEAEKKIGFFLSPGLYVSKKNPTGEPSRYQLTAAQVLEIAQRLSDLADSVHHFRYALLTKRRSSPRRRA